MSKGFLYILFLLLLQGVALTGFAQQTSEELNKKKAQLEKDIEYTNKLIQETSKNKEASLEQLNLLNTKISIRQELINTIIREVRLLDKQITETGKIVQQLESDLKKLKDEYAVMIQYAYKNKGYYDRMMFLFSAKDFNQAYKRMKYMQQYTEYREKQAELIKQTQKVLSAQIEDYEKRKKQKASLLVKSEEEKLQIATEVTEKNKLVDSLKDKEKELKAQARKKQKERAKLQKEIDRIIAKEIAAAEAKAKAEEEARAKAAGETEKPTTVRASGFSLTPAEVALSSNFASNKGKLPWPVEKGSITAHFGPQKILGNIEINNKGIDISTEASAKARAVFEGTVSAVLTIPGSNTVVMVKTGEYISVYSNIAQADVKKGDKISLKQSIGTIAVDEGSNISILHFQVWKGKILLNPEDWILPVK